MLNSLYQMLPYCGQHSVKFPTAEQAQYVQLLDENGNVAAVQPHIPVVETTWKDYLWIAEAFGYGCIVVAGSIILGHIAVNILLG